MEKIILILTKVVCRIIYFPIMLLVIFARAYATARATAHHAEVVSYKKLTEKVIIGLRIEAGFLGNQYQLGDYTINILPYRSLIELGLVFIYQPTKDIFVGWEMAGEFLNGSLLAQSITKHERGHVEAPDGFTTKRTWWNPEDWIEVGPTHTPAEIAADRWALENGADGETLIKYYKACIKYRPISMIIRIYHIRRYMKEHKNE